MDKYTCIIIEDEPLALEKTKDFVSKVPFLHLSATFDNALTGLAYLNNNKVDILFLDINMPRKTGYECMAEIKENKLLKDIFVVMFSTFYSRYVDYELEMIKKLHNIGVHDFIRKSHDFAQLKEAILKVLITAAEKRALKEEEEIL